MPAEPPPKTKTSGPAARCRQCGDAIRSTYHHDFTSCKCGAIKLDGGSSYTRCLGNPEDFEWIDE